jgi:glutamate---cysteine ligase / carboxylate-amine ligase
LTAAPGLTRRPAVSGDGVPAVGIPTVGVEEEYLLLRPDGRVADVAPEVLAAVPPGIGAHTEFARCQVEVATSVCAGLAAVGRELSAARSGLARAAADLGAHLIASGTPPVGAPGILDLTDDPRYRRLVSSVTGVHGDEITCAVQVHVEVASRDLGTAVLGRLRPWLPVLLAMSGNSPLWRGRDTGWSSHRFVVQRNWPSFGPPPVCADAADYDRRVADAVETHAAVDERGIYYWARLSPRYPTVEIRIADQCLTVADSVLLTGLCRALVLGAVADEEAGRPAPAASDRELGAAASAAARLGTRARVLDPRHGGWVPAARILDRLPEVLAPQLEVAGDAGAVTALLAARLRNGSGSDRQRALWRAGPVDRFVQAVAAIGAGGGPGG